MPAIGLYFPNCLDRAAVNALRSRLNAIAAELGYYANLRSPTAGRGNLPELLIAIDAGEVALVLLPDEQRVEAVAALDALGAEWARDIANALRAAQARTPD